MNGAGAESAVGGGKRRGVRRRGRVEERKKEGKKREEKRAMRGDVEDKGSTGRGDRRVKEKNNGRI